MTVGRSQMSCIRLIAALLVLSICGCAAKNGAQLEEISDPLEPVNRVTYKINDWGDKFILRPIAKGYEWLLPGFVRTGINNFYDNLGYPMDIVNALLQGKFTQAASDTGRLALNSTLGLAGFLDPATDIGLEQHEEDFGQTMGVWGIPQGPYLVVPLFGPRTVRSGVGNLVDALYHPQVQMRNSSLRTKINILYFINLRSNLLGIDKELQRAFDPYAFVRDAYLQNRRYLLFDGNLPDEDLFFDDEFDDEEFDDF
jgi:phospholipid-binding lipoprotein MlaA